MVKKEDLTMETKLKDLHDRLVKVGFTEEQAIQYLSNLMAKLTIYRMKIREQSNQKPTKQEESFSIEELF